MGIAWGDITAEDILAPIGGTLVAGSGKNVFSGINTDSRDLSDGNLFWVLTGERHDGHDYVGGALDKGAGGVILEDPVRAGIPQNVSAAVIRVPDTLKALGDLAHWWRGHWDIPIAAVTGSVGKTTTKEIAAKILSLGAPTLKNEGNYNNLIGLPLTLFSMKEDHRRAVLEMGMNRPGEIARLTDIADPDIGLITNVVMAHLEGLGDMDGIARAKAEMVERISPEAVVLLNGDDERLMRAARPFGKKIRTFGMEGKRDFFATKVQNMGREGTAFELHYGGRVLPLRLRVPGLQYVPNALAACALALSLGEDPENLTLGCARFQGFKGRFVPVNLPGGMTLLDDTYNANPTSLRAALSSLRDIAGSSGRIIAGLGEMLELGDETESAHREAGEMAAVFGVYHLVALGDHARDMVRGAVERGLSADKAETVDSREEMAARIMDIMKEGDLILVKGSRGMALERVVALIKDQSSEEM